jgi:hypothetical protein
VYISAATWEVIWLIRSYGLGAEGEQVIIFGGSEPLWAEIRLSLDEVEEFVKELDQAMDEATRVSENRLAEEVRNLAPHVFSKDEIE